MKANADDVLTKLSQYRNETTDEYITVAEAKQQLADGLVEHKFTIVSPETESEAMEVVPVEAIRKYFK